MSRAKLIVRTGNRMILGQDAKLVDADTGDEITCCTDLLVHFPLKGLAYVSTDIVLSAIEIEPCTELS